MNEVEFFNKAAHNWDDRCRHDKDKIIKIMELSDLYYGAKVMDVGCGTGVLIPYLTERVGEEGRVFAVDFSENMIKAAMDKYSGFMNVEFINRDVFELDMKDALDFVMCYSVFPHFEDKEKAVEKFHSFLKRNGRLIIAHSNSREHINNHHKAHEEECLRRAYLPEGNFVADILKNKGFRPDKVIDSDEMYFISGIKEF